MAFAHAPLDDALLSTAARKLTHADTAAPMRLMAARGLAPLPPGELLRVLYQFWVTNDPTLADEAVKTITTLPDAVSMAALADLQLPPGVLDFLARKQARNETILGGLLRHPNVQDETFAGMARLCPESICDQIADNQTRWLRFPAIVEALYQNPNCRMSVIHRVLELAVRQGIDVRLPNMEEIRSEIGNGVPPDPSRDALFREAAGEQVAEEHARIVALASQSSVAAEAQEAEPVPVIDADPWSVPEVDENLTLPVDEPEASEEETRSLVEAIADVPKGDRVTVISRLRPMEKIRLALLGSAFERAILIRDSNKAVSLSAIKSPRVKENEVVGYAANRTLNPDVIRYIARRRDWTKLYQVKLNLVLNPKTPMSAAMSFLGHLQGHDVRKVARSRNVPSALAQAAKRKSDQRR